MRKLFVAPLLLLLAAFAGGADPITVFLAGDSTMAAKAPEKRPETGWGEALQRHFDPARVRVDNHAQNGRSTRSFVAEGRWGAIVERLRPGDYVLVQFGHNDQKVGTDRYASPEEYAGNLARFAREVRAKGGHPVLLTPVMRRSFDAAGAFQDSHGAYPDAVRALAAREKIPLIDMHRESERILRRHGPEESRRLFLQLKPGETPNYPAGVEDNTHFSPLGAETMASLAVAAIRELRLGLAEHLSDAGRAPR